MTLQKEKSITVEDGEKATLGGRYHFVNEEGDKDFLYIYYLEKDVESSTKDPETVTITPTAKWKHEIGPTQFKRFVKNGKRNIVVARDPVWTEISQADEVETFNHQTNEFTNRKKEVTGRLEQQPLTHQSDAFEKSIQSINEKVAEKMTESENTNKSATMAMFLDAGKDAAKTVGADQVNEMTAFAIQKALSGMGIENEFLESESGKKLMKTITPLVLHYLADTQQEAINGMVGENAADNIKEACKFATQAAMQDIMGPVIEFILPMLKDLAKMGASKAGTAIGGLTAASAQHEASAVDALISQKASA